MTIIQYYARHKFERRWLRWSPAIFMVSCWIFSHFYSVTLATRINGQIFEVTSELGQIGILMIEDNGIVHSHSSFEKITRTDIHLTDSVDSARAGFGWEVYKIKSVEGTVHYRHLIVPYWFLVITTLLLIHGIFVWRGRVTGRRSKT